MNKGVLLVFSTAIISGVSIFVNQFGVKMVNPYVFTGLKNIVVVILLFGFIIFLRQLSSFKSLPQKGWFTLAIIGLVGGSIPFLMFFKGLSMTTGPEAAYLHKFLFIFVALLAPIFLKEKLHWHYLIGLVFLIWGSILLFKIKGNFQWDKGDLLVLGATVLWAVENLISKKAVGSISPCLVAWGRMSFGSLFIVIFWIITHQLNYLATLQWPQISWVFITALLLFGYVTTWYTGLRYIPVTYATAILALGAPVTSLLELMQGKTFATGQIWGIILMFTGAILLLLLNKLCSYSATLADTP